MIKFKIQKIHSYFKNLSSFKFVIYMTILTYIITVLFLPVYFLHEKLIGEMGGPKNIKNLSFFPQLIIISIITPILETLIFQFGIIEILKKVFKNIRIEVLILSSAIIFGFQHYYSLICVFRSFLIGILLAYSYILYRNKNKHAFWVVTLIHGFRNLISFIIIEIF